MHQTAEPCIEATSDSQQSQSSLRLHENSVRLLFRLIHGFLDLIIANTSDTQLKTMHGNQVTSDKAVDVADFDDHCVFTNRSLFRQFDCCTRLTILPQTGATLMSCQHLASFVAFCDFVVRANLARAADANC